MKRRIALVAALTLGLIAPAVPASAAAPRVTLAGRVLDENGRGIPTAMVRFSVEVVKDPPPSSLADDLADGFGLLFWGLGCALSFGFACSDYDDGDEPTVFRVAVNARTDASGRWSYRFDSGLRVEEQVFHGIEVSRPALVRGTLPPRTVTSVRYRGERTLPNIRLWLRGATLPKVTTAKRRLSAPVPKVLGAPVDAPEVVLVQGAKTVWSYGAVPRGRNVDARVAEHGTTGTQTRVTTLIGSRAVTYRSGVRPVTKTMRPMSRGKRCYDQYLVPEEDYNDCPVTDGRLGVRPMTTAERRQIVVDLGALAHPETYVVRGCDLFRVAASTEGVVFRDIPVEETEPGVYTGTPPVPVRYVRFDVGTCWPTEASVFGTWWESPLPPVVP